MKSWKGGSLIAVLQSLIKSHKPAGKVSFMALHSLSNYSAAGLGKWLISLLKPALRRLGHLLRDSSDLVRDLRAGRSSFPDHKLSKLDVKDFYLCGDFRKLAETAAKAAPASHASCVEAVTYFLLSNQYIKSPLLPGRLWRAVRGAGIGLMMSGELTDWCFWWLLERKILGSEVLAQWGIVRWWRFRDDILILSKDCLDVRSLVVSLKRICDIWPLKIEEANLTNIRYLDVRVVLYSSSVAVEPAYKESKLKVLLDTASGHAPSVHKSWPLMMMNRLASRCLNVSIHEMQLRLVDHWVLGGMPRDRALAFMAAASRRRRPRLQNSKQHLPVWCVLPYHPIWMKSLSRAIHKINLDSTLLRMACAEWDFTIKPSWSNFLPPMASRVMSVGGRG